MREVVLVSPIAAVRTISSFQGKLFRPTAFLFVKVSRYRSCCSSNVKSFMPLYPRILGKRDRTLLLQVSATPQQIVERSLRVKLHLF